ncbi:CHAD domain-containing protein [Pseudomonas sp. LB3P38]|uniref:CHAD domain-containing protein n=1 Tax=Pseudomonas lyxosi TaxID=3398358 RepID=UPI0039F0BD30
MIDASAKLVSIPFQRDDRMAFVDKFVAEILALQVALYHARARLEARTDSEALHDLRIAVRRIRSLLRPTRSMSQVATLNIAAAEVGRLTTPARDLEVMIQELEGRGFPAQVQLRKARLTSNYSRILKSPVLKNLFIQLDEWPSIFRSVEVSGGLKHIQPQIEKALKKQIDRLHAAVDDTEFDRHELRILVKRTRYLTEAFPRLSPLSRKAASSLKALQSALGSWHDHYQWCQKALNESDLRPLEKIWQSCAATALEKAETQLVGLAKLLPKSAGKKKPPEVAAEERARVV